MPKFTVTTAGYTITVTDGSRSRKSLCASPTAAQTLATRLMSTPAMAEKWLGYGGRMELDPYISEPPVYGSRRRSAR
jgi:hypothetical protein